MPLFSEHIANIYYGASPSYSGHSYGYNSSPSYGSSYSASYLNPGGNYMSHSSLGGYSRAPISSRWISNAGRNYSPILSTISERGSASPVRINSPRRFPISSRTYGTSSYTPRPVNINTADIDVSKDRYRHKPESCEAEPPQQIVSPNVDNENSPFMPRVDGKTESDTSSSPTVQRSTIKRGRTVVRLYTVKRKERDSPRKPINDSQNVDNATNEEMLNHSSNGDKTESKSSPKWRDKLSDDLTYKDKKDKKTLGAKLVEKFLLKDKDCDVTTKEINVPQESSENKPSTPVQNPTPTEMPQNVCLDRRCSMELLAEQANVLDSLIRNENLSTATLDLSKLGAVDDSKSNVKSPNSAAKRRQEFQNPLKTTKSDHSLHNSLKNYKDPRDGGNLPKRRSIRKSASGSSIRRLDSITEFPKEPINIDLPAIEESRISINKPKPKLKIKTKITSSVEVSTPKSPLKFRVENVIVEEKPRPLKKGITYSSEVCEIPSSTAISKLSNENKEQHKVKKKLTKDLAIDCDPESPEPADGNFWDKIGKRETIYLIKRKQNIEETKELNKRALFWFPEEEEGEQAIISNEKLGDLSGTNCSSADKVHEETNRSPIALDVQISPTIETCRDILNEPHINSNKKTKNTTDNDKQMEDKKEIVKTDSTKAEKCANVLSVIEKSQELEQIKTLVDKQVKTVENELINNEQNISKEDKTVTVKLPPKFTKPSTESVPINDNDSTNFTDKEKDGNQHENKSCLSKQSTTSIPKRVKKITYKENVNGKSSSLHSGVVSDNAVKTINNKKTKSEKINKLCENCEKNKLPKIEPLQAVLLKNCNKVDIEDKTGKGSNGGNKGKGYQISNGDSLVIEKLENTILPNQENKLLETQHCSAVKEIPKDKSSDRQIPTDKTDNKLETGCKIVDEIVLISPDNSATNSSPEANSDLTISTNLNVEEPVKSNAVPAQIESKDIPISTQTTEKESCVSSEENISVELKDENITNSDGKSENIKVEDKIDIAEPQTFTPKRPVKEEKALKPLIATPRPLQKRVPQVIHSSDSDTSSEDSSDDDEEDESDASEDSTEFFECENNTDGRTSTGSNDSGFDSSAPTSPATFSQIKKDCDVNCHRKCEKLTANLCGVNQRLLVEALATRTASKKGGDNTSGPSSKAQTNIDIMEQELEQSTAYDLFRKTGRFTPPARSIPRFRKYTIEDFQFIKVLGKGSFGKVLLAELRDTEYYYAVKCLKKDVVLEDDDVECTLIERKVLALGTNHPYLCHLFATFQTDSHLFFVMEYLNGGDLMFHIQQSGRFPEVRARFYAAEIVSGLKFLHKRGIVYRDLKLDNILLDYEGHVRIADFGMCKLQIYLDKTADTFCGTPDYMAPEIIKGLKYNQTVDWWSFGVLLYEMLIGQSPFSGCDEDELFWSICNEMPSYPRFLSHESLTILTRLLDKDARTRLGGTECMHGDIRDQEFFRPIHWDKLERRDLEAPFRPRVRHPMDTQYFDRAFTGERPRLTAVEPHVLRSMDQEPFRGFSYTNPNTTDH